MILYLDTSALVKRYVRESGSQDVQALIAKADAVGSSILARIEMASALAKAVRMEWVEAQEAEGAWHDFLSHWPAFIRISMTTVLSERAARHAWEKGLRAFDAAHLAAALIWQDTLETPVTLATYDQELGKAAKEAGLDVWPT